MPKKALTHIQKMAPGPPAMMAVAGPAMLPVPTWPAMAVARDCQADMPSLPALPFWRMPAKVRRKLSPRWRIWGKPSRTVNITPVATRTIM